AGWWVVCHNCPRVTDWVRVGHRSDQAATLFPIATSWRSFVGCPRGTWVQSLYGDKRTSVVEPQCFSSRPFRSVLISICPQRVIRVGLATCRRLPLYTYKQTSLPRVGMSRMCHRQGNVLSGWKLVQIPQNAHAVS